MGRQKAADEMFCRSCGEAIKKQAVLCPHCGVRNAADNIQRQTSEPPRPRAKQRRDNDLEDEFGELIQDIKDFANRGSGGPTRLESQIKNIRTLEDLDRSIDAYREVFFKSPPSTTWYKAIVGSTIGWIAYMVAADLFLSVDPLFLIVLASWALMPLGIYYDAKVAPEYTLDWDPSTGLYIAGALIPVIALFSGGIYLARRWYYGENRELDDAESERQKYERMMPEVNDLQSDPETAPKA